MIYTKIIVFKWETSFIHHKGCNLKVQSLGRKSNPNIYFPSLSNGQSCQILLGTGSFEFDSTYVLKSLVVRTALKKKKRKDTYLSIIKDTLNSKILMMLCFDYPHCRILPYDELGSFNSHIWTYLDLQLNILIIAYIQINK